MENVDARPGNSALLDRWVGTVGERPSARELGTELLSRWAQPHRRYHDLAHLQAVLDHLDWLVEAEPSTAPDADAVRLAAYFHDAVYDPTAPDNEVQSAALAADTLGMLGMAEERVREVVRLVLVTATHEVDEQDSAGALLCDADLAVLGGEPEAYAAYAAAVREEHGHLPEPLFRAGRAKILEALLDHDALYRTAAARSRWEQAARRNVGAELLLLIAQLDPADDPIGEGRPPGGA